MADIDVLIPTYQRPAALAVTLTALAAQTWADFRLVISDQTEDSTSFDRGEVQTALRVLDLHGHPADLHRHLPRQGLAEQRDFLLSRADAPYVLFLDDDLILEPSVIERLALSMEEQSCGFVGAAPIGLSYRDDVRPHEQMLELWDGPVTPEVVQPNGAQWRRQPLHNAANLLHVQQRLGLNDRDRVLYKVAWTGGCVLYDREKLIASGGFDFWSQLPQEHCGEEVLAQLRVMARFGGCGLLPSGVYHQELPTTITDRTYDAPHVLRHLAGAGDAGSS